MYPPFEVPNTCVLRPPCGSSFAACPTFKAPLVRTPWRYCALCGYSLRKNPESSCNLAEAGGPSYARTTLQQMSLLSGSLVYGSCIYPAQERYRGPALITLAVLTGSVAYERS